MLCGCGTTGIENCAINICQSLNKEIQLVEHVKLKNLNLGQISTKSRESDHKLEADRGLYKSWKPLEAHLSNYYIDIETEIKKSLICAQKIKQLKINILKCLLFLKK